MPGPIDSLRFVHAAILAETTAIERDAAAAGSPAELDALGAKIAYLEELVDKHTRGEEIGLFPRLAERHPHIDVGYLHDHVSERALFEELRALVAKAAEGNPDATSRLRRQAVALHEHARMHIAKENELILPLVAETFSPAEQAEMVGKILSTIEPPAMARAVVFIVSRLEVDAAAAYVSILAKAMPAPAFEAAKGWIQSGVEPSRWTALVEQLPELGST